MPLMKKKSMQILIVILVTAGGLYLALHKVQFDEVWAALRGARWGWVGAAALCALSSYVLRAYRWRLLLDKQLSVREAFGLISIGYLVSDMLPFRAGDPARGVAASLRSPVSAMMALSTVVVERTLDMLTIGVIMVLTLPFISGLEDTVGKGVLGGGTALGVILVLTLMAIYPKKVESLARWVLTRLPLGDPERWLNPLRGILDGLQALRSPHKGIKLGLLSLGIWGAVLVYYIAMQQALLYHALPARPFLVAAVVTWATALGMTTPTPGGLGGYHVAAQLALTLPFGIDQDLAAAYGWLGWGLSYLLGVGLGAVAMLSWGLSFKSVLGGQKPQET
ncbi:MAG: hypothetical protein DRI37_04885 [Chloroflexi bacterium]|nr:MAG: hypothetical protein DRI37_04885 [Chloroflexota bacterium]